MSKKALDIEARGGSIDLDALGADVFPFDAFGFNSTTGVLTLNSPCTLDATPYAPVAGEPSLGTPHPAPLDGNNLRQIYTGTPAVTASTTEVDVSAYVLAGTTEIYVEGSIKVGSNTVSQLCASKTSAANYNNGIWTVQGYGGAAFMYFPFSGWIRLDADRKFWIYITNNAILAVDMYLLRYGS